MKNKKLFDKTISILVNAYLKGTLYHSEVCACAVGNLIASYNDYSILQGGLYKCLIWENKDGEQVLADWYNDDEPWETPQIKCTGYTLQEITKIEYAFESFDWGKDDSDETGYKGLMNVVDALIEIHQGTEHHKKEAKELFTA